MAATVPVAGVRVGREAGRLAWILALVVLATPVAAARSLLGQVVCSQCWFEADRHRVAYTGEQERACAARCAAREIPPALAVLEDGAFRLHRLAGEPPGGGVWAEWATRFVQVEARLEGEGDEAVLHVAAMEAVDGDPWAERRQAEAAAPAELAWDDLTGHPFALASLRGRITVLNFWATWCKPCADEMPDLAGIQNRWGHLGVQVVGAAADQADKADAVRRFARRHEIPFPLLVGATGEEMSGLGLPPTLPGTVILDRGGDVVRRYPGVIDRRTVERDLRDLLEGPGPARPAAAEPAASGGHAHAAATEASLVPS